MATSDLTGLFLGCIVASGRRVRGQSQQSARGSKCHSCLGLGLSRAPGIHVDPGRIYLTDTRRAVCGLSSSRDLTDVLTPSNLLPLFTSHPALLSSLFPHLPPDLLPPGNAPLTPHQTTQLAESLQRTINSLQFRVAVAQLDRALRTGVLGGFVRNLGLPESAGTGVGAFLRAIGEQARREGSGQGKGGADKRIGWKKTRCLFRRTCGIICYNGNT